MRTTLPVDSATVITAYASWPRMAAENHVEVRTITELAGLLGHEPGSTAAQVMRFLAEAPVADRDRLRLGWPVEVKAWELWHHTDKPVSWAMLRGMMCPDYCGHDHREQDENTGSQL